MKKTTLIKNKIKYQVLFYNFYWTIKIYKFKNIAQIILPLWTTTPNLAYSRSRKYNDGMNFSDDTSEYCVGL